MDLVTQAILGAAVAEGGGWRKDLGKSAIFAGIFFGMMPDFDIVARLWGEWESLIHHRGFTHSLLFAPLVCGPFGWLIWKSRGEQEGMRRRWMTLVFWALITHPLLDLFTSYGTQLLTPLSDHRFALDGISIIDPLYTFPLLFALILAAVWRRDPGRGQKVVAGALTLTTLYLGVGTWQSYSVEERTRAQLEPELKLEKVRALPTFGNILLWRVVAKEQRGTIHVGLHSQVAPREAIAFTPVEPLDSPLVAKALAHPHGQLYQWFADDLLAYSIEEAKDGSVVLKMEDMRYGGIQHPTTSMWGAKATFDAEEKLVSMDRYNDRGASMGDPKKEFAKLWDAIWRGP